MAVSARRSRVGIRPRIVGIIGTVLVHVMVMQSFILGTSTKKYRVPPHQGPGSSALSKGVESALTLVVVQSFAPIVLEETLMEEMASHGVAPATLAMGIISPDVAPSVDIKPEDIDHENNDAASAITGGDPAGRARLFGIYSGQIQARIERAWRRPRTPVNGSRDLGLSAGYEIFHCQARILQDAGGNVTEILLPKCNGSAAWQSSLVMAIQQSSPLPAPPNPTVFSNAMTLTFSGYEYTPTRAPDDYEIPARVLQVQRVIPNSTLGRNPDPSPNLTGGTAEMPVPP